MRSQFQSTWLRLLLNGRSSQVSAWTLTSHCRRDSKSRGGLSAAFATQPLRLLAFVRVLGLLASEGRVHSGLSIFANSGATFNECPFPARRLTSAPAMAVRKSTSYSGPGRRKRALQRKPFTFPAHPCSANLARTGAHSAAVFRRACLILHSPRAAQFFTTSPICEPASPEAAAK